MPANFQVMGAYGGQTPHIPLNTFHLQKIGKSVFEIVMIGITKTFQILAYNYKFS